MNWLRPRIIPVLLLKGNGLYKTVRFKNPVYVGDPINTVKIFNEKEVDEIVLLDIGASLEGREPNYERISEIAGEAFMPLAYGGGVRTVEQAKKLLSLGVEKIVLNSAAVEDPDFVKVLSAEVGSQSVVVSVDVRKTLFGKYHIAWKNGQKTRSQAPLDWARQVTELGAGEILIHCIDRDGVMQGCDTDLIRAVSHELSVPVIGCGGAGSVGDLADVLRAGASAAAAGAMFVFQGKHRAVLISYPEAAEIDQLLPR